MGLRRGKTELSIAGKTELTRYEGPVFGFYFMIICMVLLAIFYIYARFVDQLGILIALLTIAAAILFIPAVLLTILIRYYPLIGSIILCFAGFIVFQNNILVYLPLAAGLVSLAQLYLRHKKTQAELNK